jgi:hypothetical protein
MDILNVNIVFKDGFPSDAQRIVLSRDAILQAAVELKDTEIQTRMSCEPMYVRELAKPVRVLTFPVDVSLLIFLEGKHTCQSVPR